MAPDGSPTSEASKTGGARVLDSGAGCLPLPQAAGVTFEEASTPDAGSKKTLTRLPSQPGIDAKRASLSLAPLPVGLPPSPIKERMALNRQLSLSPVSSPRSPGSGASGPSTPLEYYTPPSRQFRPKSALDAWARLAATPLVRGESCGSASGAEEPPETTEASDAGSERPEAGGAPSGTERPRIPDQPGILERRANYCRPPEGRPPDPPAVRIALRRSSSDAVIPPALRLSRSASAGGRSSFGSASSDDLDGSYSPPARQFRPSWALDGTVSPDAPWRSPLRFVPAGPKSAGPRARVAPIPLGLPPGVGTTSFAEATGVELAPQQQHADPDDSQSAAHPPSSIETETSPESSENGEADGSWPMPTRPPTPTGWEVCSPPALVVIPSKDRASSSCGSPRGKESSAFDKRAEGERRPVRDGGR